MNEYDLKNVSVNIPYKDFNRITEELSDLRDFIRQIFWCCNTPEEIKIKASELNLIYEYWLGETDE